MKIKNSGWQNLVNVENTEVQMYSDDKVIRIDAVNDVDWVVLTIQLVN